MANSASSETDRARGATRRRARTLALVLPFLAVGCEDEPAAEGPAQVVEAFIQNMQRVHGDGRAARSAYELLWAPARQNLAERAKRASAATGRRVAPEEMIAPSRFSLRFEPRQYSARLEGKWAEVTAVGDAPSTQLHRIRCFLEDGHWRVVLELPPLEPIRKRPDDARE